VPIGKTVDVGIKGRVIEPSAPGRLRIQMDGGRVLDAGFVPPADAVEVEVRVICEIPSRTFDRCPVCLEPSPSTREHVPPEAVGGKVRTMTCGPCNHNLATLVEADLAAWYDQRLLGVRFTKDTVPGGRGAFVNLRTTTDGEFVLTATRADSAIPAMLDAGGEFGMEFCEAEESRYRVALLKHAYLTACLHLGTIPDGEAAAAVRAELLAVRDAPDRDDLPASPIAQALRIGRSYRPHDGALFLAWMTREDEEEPLLAIVLGGFVVSWPIADPVVIDAASRGLPS